MRRAALPALAVALLVGLPLVAASADGVRTLEGEYSSGDGDGPVRATFTPVGSGLWEVAFDFTFGGHRNTYRGTAEGSFAEGSLSGRVKTRSGHRTFTFRGEYQDGVFRGTHAEVERGREVPTGELHMKG